MATRGRVGRALSGGGMGVAYWAVHVVSNIDASGLCPLTARELWWMHDINPGQDDASGPRDGASRPDTGSFVPPDAGGDQSVLSDGSEDDTRSDPTPGLEVVLWTEYDGYIKTDGLNGSWDIPRTQAAMDDLGATTLSKVVKDDRGYDGLVQLLKLTKDTRIKVWAMLPWNCMGKLTRDRNPETACQTWATHLAELSLEHPHFTAMRLDDLAPTVDNRSLVTPAWFDGILAAKNKINPDFRVIPVMYYEVRKEMEQCLPGNEFHGVFKDGITFPYWASFRGAQYVDLGKLESLVETADTKIHPIPFITTIYPLAGGALDKSRDPKDYFHSPAVLKQMIETATEKSDGLGLFWFPLYTYDTDHLLEATIFQPQDNDDASYDHKLTNSGKSMLTSWFQAIKEQVPAGEVKLTFDARDSRTTAECGWLFKQALIDGKVVWSKDVCKDGKERETVSVKATTSQAAQVVIRIFCCQSQPHEPQHVRHNTRRDRRRQENRVKLDLRQHPGQPGRLQADVQHSQVGLEGAIGPTAWANSCTTLSPRWVTPPSRRGQRMLLSSRRLMSRSPGGYPCLGDGCSEAWPRPRWLSGLAPTTRDRSPTAASPRTKASRRIKASRTRVRQTRGRQTRGR